MFPVLDFCIRFSTNELEKANIVWYVMFLISRGILILIKFLILKCFCILLTINFERYFNSNEIYKQLPYDTSCNSYSSLF